jgi:hypothetical protein
MSRGDSLGQTAAGRARTGGEAVVAGRSGGLDVLPASVSSARPPGPGAGSTSPNHGTSRACASSCGRPSSWMATASSRSSSSTAKRCRRRLRSALPLGWRPRSPRPTPAERLERQTGPAVIATAGPVAPGVASVRGGEPGRRRTPDVAAAREGQTMRVTEATMRLPECSGLLERPFRPVLCTPSEGGGSPRPTGAPAGQVISPSP